VSVAETSQETPSIGTSVTSKADRKPESRACKMHIVGGIAMLGIGIALLIIV